MFCRGNRPTVLPSELYTAWHKDVSIQLWKIKNVLRDQDIELPLTDVKIKLTFYPPDRIKSDLTNKAESVMDCLVDNRILVDDNWFECGDIHLLFGEIDKQNPRVQIEILNKHVTE